MKKTSSIKEKRQERRIAFRSLVIVQAEKIISDNGLDALSMRAIASQIGCSQSKIYEVFKDKNHLCETLCAELSETLLGRLQNIRMGRDSPEDYLRNLFIEILFFHEEHPHSDNLFTLVCYGGRQFNLPIAFREIENMLIAAIKELDSVTLDNDEKIALALNAIRFLFIGASQINIFGKHRAQEIAKNALDTLICGWKK